MKSSLKSTKGAGWCPHPSKEGEGGRGVAFLEEIVCTRRGSVPYFVHLGLPGEVPANPASRVATGEEASCSGLLIQRAEIEE